MTDEQRAQHLTRYDERLRVAQELVQQCREWLSFVPKESVDAYQGYLIEALEGLHKAHRVLCLDPVAERPDRKREPPYSVPKIDPDGNELYPEGQAWYPDGSVDTVLRGPDDIVWKHRIRIDGKQEFWRVT